MVNAADEDARGDVCLVWIRRLALSVSALARCFYHSMWS